MPLPREPSRRLEFDDPDPEAFGRLIRFRPRHPYVVAKCQRPFDTHAEPRRYLGRSGQRLPYPIERGREVNRATDAIVRRVHVQPMGCILQDAWPVMQLVGCAFTAAEPGSGIVGVTMRRLAVTAAIAVSLVLSPRAAGQAPAL